MINKLHTRKGVLFGMMHRLYMGSIGWNVNYGHFTHLRKYDRSRVRHVDQMLIVLKINISY